MVEGAFLPMLIRCRFLLLAVSLGFPLLALASVALQLKAREASHIESQEFEAIAKTNTLYE